MLIDAYFFLLDFIPYIFAAGFIAIAYEEARYHYFIKLSKIKSRVRNFGHALIYAFQFIYFFTAISTVFYVGFFVFNFFNQLDLSLIIRLLVFLGCSFPVFFLVAYIGSMLMVWADDYDSNFAKSSEKEVQKIRERSPLLTQNQEKEVIAKLRQDRIRDLRKNFWVGRVAR